MESEGKWRNLSPPYVLRVTIHRAENLAIADYTTSDPFVLVSVDGKEIGKTPTVYRNHLSPSWEKTYSTPLTHCHSILCMKIFDEDYMKEGDFMGLVTMDLSTCITNMLVEKQLPLRQRIGNDALAKGKLYFSVLLEKNESLIRIVDRPASTNNVISDESVSIIEEEVSSLIGDSLVSRSETLVKSLVTSPLIAESVPLSSSSSTAFFRREVLRDLLCDVRSLLKASNKLVLSTYEQQQTSEDVHLEEDKIPMEQLRCQRPLINAVEINLLNNSYIRTAPIRDNGIRLILGAGKGVYFLRFPRKNRYLIWIWVRWLSFAANYSAAGVGGEEERSPLPPWAAEGRFKSPLTLICESTPGSSLSAAASSSQRPAAVPAAAVAVGSEDSGSCTVTIKPFQLTVQDAESSKVLRVLPLDSLEKMVVSVDAVEPKEYNLQVELVSAKIGVVVGASNNISSQHATATATATDEANIGGGGGGGGGGKISKATQQKQQQYDDSLAVAAGDGDKNDEDQGVAGQQHHHHHQMFFSPKKSNKKSKDEKKEEEHLHSRSATDILSLVQGTINPGAVAGVAAHGLKSAMKQGVAIGQSLGAAVTVTVAQTRTFLVIKSRNMSHTTEALVGPHPQWGESVYLEVDDSDVGGPEEARSNYFTTAAAAAGDADGSGGRSHENEPPSLNVRSFPPVKNDRSRSRTDDTIRSYHGGDVLAVSDHDCGFEVFLHSGVYGSEALVGYQYVPFSALLPLRSNNNDSRRRSGGGNVDRAADGDDSGGGNEIPPPASSSSSSYQKSNHGHGNDAPPRQTNVVRRADGAAAKDDRAGGGGNGGGDPRAKSESIISDMSTAAVTAATAAASLDAAAAVVDDHTIRIAATEGKGCDGEPPLSTTTSKPKDATVLSTPPRSSSVGESDNKKVRLRSSSGSSSILKDGESKTGEIRSSSGSGRVAGRGGGSTSVLGAGELGVHRNEVEICLRSPNEGALKITLLQGHHLAVHTKHKKTTTAASAAAHNLFHASVPDKTTVPSTATTKGRKSLPGDFNPSSVDFKPSADASASKNTSAHKPATAVAAAAVEHGDEESYSGSVYIKCKLTNWYGRERKHTFASSLTTAEMKSPAVKSEVEVDFKNHDFILSPSLGGLEWADYVKLEIFAKHLVLADDFLGAVYIPIEEFRVAGAVRTYAVLNTRDVTTVTGNFNATVNAVGADNARLTVRLERMVSPDPFIISSLAVPPVSLGAGSLGSTPQRKGGNKHHHSSLTNKIFGIVKSDPAAVAAASKLVTVKLRCQLRDNNEFTTLWPAEGVLSGTMTSQEPRVEQFCVAAAYEGLVLRTVSPLELVFNNRLRFFDRRKGGPRSSKDDTDTGDTPGGAGGRAKQQKRTRKATILSTTTTTTTATATKAISSNGGIETVTNDDDEEDDNDNDGDTDVQEEDGGGIAKSMISEQSDTNISEAVDRVSTSLLLPPRHTNNNHHAASSSSSAAAAVVVSKMVSFRDINNAVATSSSIAGAAPVIHQHPGTSGGGAPLDQTNEHINRLAAYSSGERRSNGADNSVITTVAAATDEAVVAENTSASAAKRNGHSSGSSSSSSSNSSEEANDVVVVEDRDDAQKSLLCRSESAMFLVSVLEIEVFENEVRGGWFLSSSPWGVQHQQGHAAAQRGGGGGGGVGCGWGCMDQQISRFSDETGLKPARYRSLAEALPPPEYQWVGDWWIDKLGGITDEDGWSYASSYVNLCRGYLERKAMRANFTKPIRRRRWSRTARLKPEYHGLASMQLPLTAATLHMHDERDTAERIMKKQQGVRDSNASAPGAAGDTNNIGVLERLRCGEGEGVGEEGEDGSHPESKAKKAKPILNDDADADSEDEAMERRKRAETTTDIDIPLPSRIARAASTLRLTEFNLNKDIVIGLCKERLSTTSSSVIIPWDQVSSVEIITESVLSVCMQVHRYFGEDDHGDKLFHPADVELFITHCNAPVLKSMIQERREFVRLREELKAILSSGNIKCEVRTRARAGRNAARGLSSSLQRQSSLASKRGVSARKRMLMLEAGNDVDGDGVYDIDDEEEDEEDSQTERGTVYADEDDNEEHHDDDGISRGSATVAYLDHNAIDIEAKVDELWCQYVQEQKTLQTALNTIATRATILANSNKSDTNTGITTYLTACVSSSDSSSSAGAGITNGDNRSAILTVKRLQETCKNFLNERTFLIRRACRLRLYIATLLGAQLEGSHSFTETSVRKIMVHDFDVAAKIELGEEVATATNRMEFLLDTAETRLRDAALCGWVHQGEENAFRLERSLEIFVNGYFIELVGLLAKFFKGNDGMRKIQGLQSKLKLITSFMEHDDRLASMLDSALRPYGLTASPKPQLSLFLNLDTLVSWYSSVLHQEMRACVNSVVNIWKDVTKDAGGLTAKYHYPLPWVPMRSRGEEGQFRTLLPEDCATYLDEYITATRLDESNIASSFWTYIDKLDGKVSLSVANAFLHLADVYASALRSTQWVNPADSSVGKSSVGSASSVNMPASSSSGTHGEISDEEREQLDEHTEWLCSVANDARRVTETAIISKIGVKSYSDSVKTAAAAAAAATTQQQHNTTTRTNAQTHERTNAWSSTATTGTMSQDTLAVAKIGERAYDAFTVVATSALDYISCIIFRTLLSVSGDEFKVLDKDLYKRWNTALMTATTAAAAAAMAKPASSSASSSASGGAGDQQEKKNENESSSLFAVNWEATESALLELTQTASGYHHHPRHGSHDTPGATTSISINDSGSCALLGQGGGGGNVLFQEQNPMITAMRNKQGTSNRSLGNNTNSTVTGTNSSNSHHWTPRKKKDEIYVVIPPPAPLSRLVDLEFLEMLIEEKREYLDPYSFYKLITLCIDKVVMIYLTLLHDGHAAANKVIEISGFETVQLISDVMAVKKMMVTLCKHNDMHNYRDAILSRLRPLQHSLTLLCADRTAPEFEKTLESILKVAEGHAESAEALASFALCCVQLRADSKAVAAAAVAKQRRQSALSSVAAAAAAQSAAPSSSSTTTSTADSKPRKGMMGYLFGVKKAADKTASASTTEDKTTVITTTAAAGDSGGVVTVGGVGGVLPSDIAYKESSSDGDVLNSALELIEDIRAQSTEGFTSYKQTSPSFSTTTPGVLGDDDEVDYGRPLADITPERRVFERPGTYIGDLSLAVKLIGSANPPAQVKKTSSAAEQKNGRRSSKLQRVLQHNIQLTNGAGVGGGGGVTVAAAGRSTHTHITDITVKNSDSTGGGVGFFGGLFGRWRKSGVDTTGNSSTHVSSMQLPSTKAKANEQQAKPLRSDVNVLEGNYQQQQQQGEEEDKDDGEDDEDNNNCSSSTSHRGTAAGGGAGGGGGGGQITTTVNSSAANNGRRRSRTYARRPSIAPDMDVVTIIVSGLKLSSLFYVDTLRTPRPFLEISLDDQVLTTTSDREGTNCSWPNDEYEFTLSRSSLAYKELAFTLYYKARLYGDIKIGCLSLSLSSLDISPLEEVVTQFDCITESSSPEHAGRRQVPKRVVDAARRAVTEGRDVPTLYVTVWLRDGSA